MVVRARVTVRFVHIDSSTAFLLGKKLFHFPVIHPCTYGELEVFFRDRIPILQIHC